MSGLLAVRLGSDGDVLVTGPAVRALAASGPVDLLVSPTGEQAAAMLPDVRSVLTFDAPWTGCAPPPVEPRSVDRMIADVGARRYEKAVVFTSAHQSPLPAALVLRLAGVPMIAATSEDYPGTLLDLRHRPSESVHEVDAALDLAIAAGGSLAADDDGCLTVRRPLPDVAGLVPDRPYVVLHPAAVRPRAPAAAHAAELASALAAAGWSVVVTGSVVDRDLTRRVAWADHTYDLGGRTTFAELAAVLAGARAAVVGNIGPAHLAAAVGTPVVCLFAPVVPAERWSRYGVASVALGDQDATVGTDARTPCLTSVEVHQVVDAVATLSRKALHPQPARVGA